MATELRARTSAGYRHANAVMAAILTLLSCFALIMAVYNLIKGNYLFMIAWLIATVLAGTYVLIRVNTVFSTYIMTDRVSLYMKNWSNDFLPYDYGNKIKILSEFIPAKTKIVEIPLGEINAVYIGTKNFIKRNANPDSDFIKNIQGLEKTKDFYRKRTVSSMDIFYVETYDNECYYMPIVKFDSKDVIKIVQTIERRNPDLVVKSSNKLYRKLQMRR